MFESSEHDDSTVILRIVRNMVDFILSNNGKMKLKLYPIEVKSGERYTTDSLDLFLRKYHQRIDRAYIVHTKNLAANVEIVCVPAYMAILL